mmetsp:Transcript_99475/g.176515  ORF Transcript_99475/g.176515 Transcript_99475/m.176515 type:complete len:692 (-) Transcript_99475:218-2293(-)
MMLRPISAAPGPEGFSHTSLSFGEDDASSAQSCIFSDVVSVHVKPSGRDEFVASLTVRLRPDNAAHPRSMLLELTDESDLFFYHSLVLGEGDFHTLKSEQRLLVDFQSFPSQLVDLLRRCMESTSAPANASPVSSGGSLQMLARLDCGSGGDSTFSIIESNQFRELTYIALRLRQGTDEAVKQYLAGKLRSYKTDNADLSERLRASEESLGQMRIQVEDLVSRARTATEERTHLERSMDANHQRDVAVLRQEHARAVVDLQQAASEERTRIEAELRDLHNKALSRAETAERMHEDLQHQHHSLTSSSKSCRERLEASEVQLREARQEAQVMREQQKQLELLKFQHERELGERGVHLSSLQEQLAAKEQLVVNHASQHEQGSAQRRALEDSLAISKQQVHALEEKFNISAQEIAKGNQIIQSLRTTVKQLKSKLKLKNTALVQQEKSVSEFKQAGETSKHVIEEKEHELLRAREREERHQQDLEGLRKKLSEAHEVIKSNQDVIEYLNRQLTDRDLKALSPMAGQERETRSTALNDFLKRAESVGRGAKPLGFSASSGLNAGLGAAGLGGALAKLGTATPSSLTGPSVHSAALGFGTSMSGMNALTYPSSSQISGSPLGPGSGQAALAGTGFSSLSTGTSARVDLASTATDTVSSGLPESMSAVAAASATSFAGRDPLLGPVTYRSPAISVK